MAAYVETEQILHFGADPASKVAPLYTSFIQIRGSIPLFWKQDINLAYEPPIEIDSSDDSPLRLHLSEQVNFYNKQVLVNLVKKKGAEGPLGDAYEQVVKSWNNEKIKYVGFDVYQYCKNSDYGKLSFLVDQIERDLHDLGFFMSDGKQVKKSQSGVFRTNCKGDINCGL